MITRVIIRNFKRFEEQEFGDLGSLHLLVGQNNSGKSTLLQALAIWSFCIEQFRMSARSGERAIEITLPNFTPLPLPEFRLLWLNKTERKYTQLSDPASGKMKRVQEFIRIELDVEWQTRVGTSHQFRVELRYQTRQTVYARPVGGWERFRALDREGAFPRVVYVPPTSNIEDREQWVDDPVLGARVGRGQPGSIVRNVLLRTAERQGGLGVRTPFGGLTSRVKDWFGVDVCQPEYRRGQDQYITSVYRTADQVELDWVNAGSGLLQTLIVLSFLYGFEPDVLLLDEPDAHLHVNLQRSLLQFLSKTAREESVQMLIATHAEEFIRNVDASQITFLTPGGPRPIKRVEAATFALSEISNLDLVNLIERRVFVYVEGETDAELLRAWAGVLDGTAEFEGIESAIESRVAFIPLGGGSADEMKERADRHFDGARLLSDRAERVMLLDRNNRATLPADTDGNPVLRVWKRRHVENYLLIPHPWQRVVERDFELHRNIVDGFFFDEQGFSDRTDWLSDTVESLNTSRAKLLLFDARQALNHYDALNARLYDHGLIYTRHDIASAMRPEEVHRDVRDVLRLIYDKTRVP